MTDKAHPLFREILWIDAGPYPFNIGFTMSSKALRAEFKRLGDPISKDDVLRAGASAVVWKTEPATSLKTTAICYLPKPPEGITDVQIAALLAHEALHIVQYIWERIGETVRREAEAYLLQHIFQTMYAGYRKAMGID